jgi:hypothetical protein
MQAADAYLRLKVFSQMLRFHIEAVLSTAPKAEVSASLSHMHWLVKIVGCYLEPMGTDTSGGERLPIVAALALQAIDSIVGSDAYSAAKALPRPKSVILFLRRPILLHSCPTIGPLSKYLYTRQG